ncbi:hypothetical protein PAXRUDRAFT_52503, partial [Paxillus rubicundulus Ve08.2h10]
IARVQRSNRQCQQADWNWDYQRTVNKDAAQRAQWHANSESNASLLGTIPEAYAGPDTDHWKSAIEEELLNLNSNHVYETVPILEGITPITSKPIFHIKRDHTGNVECYKARIV